jgi:sugar lactone lactonase YvrE
MLPYFREQGLLPRPWLGLVLGVWLLWIRPAPAWAINTGDIIVADRRESGLVFVDRLTGAQHQLSPSLPGGQGFIDVTTNVSGDVFAVAAASGGVYKIDTVNGGHTLISSGGYLTYPFSVDWAPDGNLYVTQAGAPGLIQVSPSSGAQTLIVSGSIQGFAVDASNVAYITILDGAVAPAFHLYKVDLGSGQTTKISTTGLRSPAGLTIDANGNIIVVDGGGSGTTFAIFRVDPTTGSFTTVSSGGPMMNPWGLTLEANGTVVVADHQKLNACNPPPPAPITCPGALYRIDPTTGVQTLVTEKDLFHDIAGADLYRGPNVATPTRRSSWGRLKADYR